MSGDETDQSEFITAEVNLQTSPVLFYALPFTEILAQNPQNIYRKTIARVLSSQTILMCQVAHVLARHYLLCFRLLVVLKPSL